MSGRRIGLLGGSFNPAHEGHLHISREAIKRLSLKEVWWLVAPKNPLKRTSELAPYAKRLASAKALAKDRRIRVLDVEKRYGLFYTVDTLRWLKRRYPKDRFVWLMGADNLTDFHRWRQWKTVAGQFPIAILDRTPYAFPGLRGRFSLCLRHWRIKASSVLTLADRRTPAWLYLIIPRHGLSSTHLRKTLGPEAFVRHNARH